MSFLGGIVGTINSILHLDLGFFLELKTRFFDGFLHWSYFVDTLFWITLFFSYGKNSFKVVPSIHFLYFLYITCVIY